MEEKHTHTHDENSSKNNVLAFLVKERSTLNVFDKVPELSQITQRRGRERLVIKFHEVH